MVAEHAIGCGAVGDGRQTEARAEYRRALRLDSTDASTWLNLGNLERRAGAADSALACYRRAEACDSSLALALQGQIGILREKKRDAEAADAYLRWLAQHPDHTARVSRPSCCSTSWAMKTNHSRWRAKASSGTSWRASRT
jgi:tetratricopeptide (TPR) repeat protein